MAFIQYAKTQGIIVFETGLKEPLGVLDLAADTELSHILLTFFKSGTPVGNERIRLNLYSTDRYESSFVSSGWVNVSDIDGLSANWLGWLRFDFTRNGIDSDEQIYVEVETANYTRNGDTFYMGCGTDWPHSFNTYTAADGAPAALQVFGYR